MDILITLAFFLVVGVGAMLFGVDSRDSRRPYERIDALFPLR
jgi:hypothetical protein